MQKQSSLFLKIIILFIITAFNVACVKQVIISHDLSIEKVLFTISNTVSETDILSAVAQIALVTPRGYYPAKAALILKKPSYLRLELLPPMGPPDFFLVTTPKEMRILLPTKGEFYQGEPTGHNLSRFLPWQFNIEDIVAIFANTYPLLTGDVAYLHYPEGNNLRIEMKVRSAISQIVWIGPNGRLIKLVRYDGSGKPLYSAEFADYEEGSTIAGKITVSMADGVTSITIKYSDLKIEKAKDLSIFNLPIPAGFKTIMMD